MKKFLLQIGLPVFGGLLIGVLIIAIKPEIAGFKEGGLMSLFDSLSDHSNNLLHSGQVSYRSAVKKAAPSVVNIASSSLDRSDASATPMPYRDTPDSDSNRGSAVIVSPDGYLLTNNHVIKGAERIYVSMQDGREEIASIVGRDPETDLAVLKIDLKNLPSINLADSSKAEVGDVVLAIGNPFGLGQTVTMGIISATGRDDLRLNTYEDFIQTDAAINVGNSGGALINAYGELIGISTLLFSRGGGNEGVGFAIPSSMAQFVMDSIIKYGRVIRGWLGIESQPLNAQLANAYGVKTNAGILISGVYQDSPAEKAGLRRGDILTGINNISTMDGNKVMNLVAQVPPGSEVSLQILRDNKPMEIKARVSTRPRMVN